MEEIMKSIRELKPLLKLIKEEKGKGKSRGGAAQKGRGA